MDINYLFQQTTQAHQAAYLYRQVLAQAPYQADTHHLLVVAPKHFYNSAG